MVNEQQDDWHLYIEQACWGIRSSYNESTKHTPYEVMHIRKPRFPSELPTEEDPAPISLQEPTPNEVADYISTKQEQLTAVEAKVCYITNKIIYINAALKNAPYMHTRLILYSIIPQAIVTGIFWGIYTVSGVLISTKVEIVLSLGYCQ